MNLWRVLVTTSDGAVVVTEFHDQAATANERATAHRQTGHTVVVTEGRRGANGTFTPS